ILSDYVIEDFTVKHHLEDEDMGFVKLTMEKNTSMEDIADDFEQQYNEELEDVSVREQPEMDTPYSGLSQSGVDRSGDAYDSFVGYYVFQVEDDVLIIDYKYMVEAADGISPRIQDMIESIKIEEEASKRKLMLPFLVEVRWLADVVQWIAVGGRHIECGRQSIDWEDGT